MGDDNIIMHFGGESPDNFERGDRALHALAFYMRGGVLEGFVPEEVVEVGEGAIPVPRPDGTMATLPEAAPVSYLIADLLHLVTRYGLDPMEKINEGIEHWGADILEQSFSNDAERWTEIMQEDENLDVAEDVLRINRVPRMYWASIMVKTGMISLDQKDEYDDQLGD